MGSDLKITDVGDGLIQFKFAIESQLVWVLNKGMTAFSVNFQSVPIWVQVWGLLLDLINEEAGRDIARAIGRVLRWIARQLRRTKRGSFVSE
ncbi:hypothetical protein CFP56_042126 [Quercus suber]|uniref:DUF4283 domain-containing protein n=1 Tax=Quercus suber TaxID=58331 RepID=A0AAW0MAC3_QUESU